MLNRLKFRDNEKGAESARAQLAAYFRKAIKDRQLKPNEKLPTTKEIVSQFGVSSHTVRGAMEILESEGLINMTPRRGTFVNFKYPFSRNDEKNQKALASASSSDITGAIVGVFGLVNHSSPLGGWDAFRVDSARGAIVECDRYGLAMINLPVSRDMPDEQCIEIAKHYNCKGVLWCDEHLTPLQKFAKADMPAVLMCRNQPSSPTYSTVCLDYYKAGRDVVEIITSQLPENSKICIAHLEYPDACSGAFVNHFLGGLQSHTLNKPHFEIQLKTWNICQLRELLHWLESIAEDVPVIFICSYHLLGLLAHYKEETCSALKNRLTFAISNREPNLQLLSCKAGLDPYIIYDDFAKLSSIGIQKLVSLMGGLLDNTTTTIQLSIDRLSRFSIESDHFLLNI